MNCNYVKDLLPLYVGRDLEEKRATEITKHLQACDACAGSAEEYREARELLYLYAPPPVSEGVYAGIRQRVLREIEAKQSVPALTPFLARFFRPRIRWAVATAVLLAVSVSVFYFVANKNENRLQVAENRPVAERIADIKVPIERAKVNKPSTPGSPASTHGPIFRPQPSGRRPGTEPSDRATTLAVKKSDPGLTTAAPDAVATRVPTAQEKTLRMEMQTRDPNIRIIWFSPQRTKHDSPNKSTKRNQEAGTNA